MASSFASAIKDNMLSDTGLGATPNLLSLHSGDPGAAGTDNELSGGGYARQSAVFDSPSGGVRALNAQVDFNGTPSTSVTWFAVWEDDTSDVFIGRGEITAGDTTVNASGDYSLTTDTELRIDDDVS